MKSILTVSDTGRITNIQHSADVRKLDLTGKVVFDGLVPASALEDSFVRGKLLLRRAEQPTKLSGMKLSKLPAPCTIRVNDTDYECVDTTATLSFEFAGTYTVTVIAFPYLDWTTEITV